jgi:hypothetical protein
MQTGTRTVSYAGDAAPAGFPSASSFGAGDILVTFASSYNDPYGVAGAFSISHAHLTLLSATLGGASVDLLSATSIRCSVFDSTGTGITDARMSLTVW